MKKVLIVLSVIAVIICAVLLYQRTKPAVSADYESGETGTALEKKYLAHGPYATAYRRDKVFQRFGSVQIWYPSELPDSDQTYPVIVIHNGTGVPADKYRAVFAHYASWGFIVLGSPEEYTWDGTAGDICLHHLLQKNQDKDDIFYNHVNTDAIGTLGHSQGGVGVFNSVGRSSLYKAAAAESPTNMPLAAALEWDYDPAQIRIPILLLSSVGNTDENTVISGRQLQDIFDAVPDTAVKVRARRKNADHGDMVSCCDGIVTAWFLYFLCDDEEAGRIFFGDAPDLLSDSLYQDVEIHA